MARTILIAFAVIISNLLLWQPSNADPRPDGKNTTYTTTTRSGDSRSMDALDIIAVGAPNHFDLIDGDSVIVFHPTHVEFYNFNATSTQETAEPKYVRPIDYDNAGVWEKINTEKDIIPLNNITTDLVLKPGTYKGNLAGAGVDLTFLWDLNAERLQVITLELVGDGINSITIGSGEVRYRHNSAPSQPFSVNPTVMQLYTFDDGNTVHFSMTTENSY